MRNKKNNILKKRIKFLFTCFFICISIIIVFYLGKILGEKNLIEYTDSIIIESNNISKDKEKEKTEDNTTQENSGSIEVEYNIKYLRAKDDELADNSKLIETMIKSCDYSRDDNKKVAYLTFDDGPSNVVTTQILDILKLNNIKATFFVLGNVLENNLESQTVLKRIVEEGHAIGNHGYSHDYKSLFPDGTANIERIINDYEKSEKIIQSIIGESFNAKVIRIPGGHMSWNTTELDPILEEKGYTYIDWNTLNGDAEMQSASGQELVERFKETYNQLGNNNESVIILMHDSNSKQSTVDSLQKIIDYLSSMGYEFKSIKN